MIYEVRQVEENSKNFITQVVGHFTNYYSAYSAVVNNETDINETCFNKAFILELCEGLHYEMPESVTIFKFNKKTGQYEEQEKLDEFEYYDYLKAHRP